MSCEILLLNHKFPKTSIFSFYRYENYDIFSCLNAESSRVDEENDATLTLINNTLTPNPQIVFPSDFESLISVS